jgi:malate dehydrogenase
MAEAITGNEKRVFPCCVKLEGEYGLENVFVGVPVILGKNGIERIIELQLTGEERRHLYASAASVKEMMDVLDTIEIKNRRA